MWKVYRVRCFDISTWDNSDPFVRADATFRYGDDQRGIEETDEYPMKMEVENRKAANALLEFTDTGRSQSINTRRVRDIDIFASRNTFTTLFRDRRTISQSL